MKRKCGAHSLAANSSANVLLKTIRLLFWLVHYVNNHYASVIAEKRHRHGSEWRSSNRKFAEENVIGAVQSDILFVLNSNLILTGHQLIFSSRW